MTTKKIDPVGAQPTDPPWARLLFLLVQGREGQWWRGSLLMALAGLLVVALFGVLAAVLPASWVGGALGVGSLTVAALARRRRQPPPR
ncbi:MAG: hypothetical protein ACRDSL_22080 [Pseudonocardiaceae bacterium]